MDADVVIRREFNTITMCSVIIIHISRKIVDYRGQWSSCWKYFSKVVEVKAYKMGVNKRKMSSVGTGSRLLDTVIVTGIIKASWCNYKNVVDDEVESLATVNK
jgi:hypothetical protein